MEVGLDPRTDIGCVCPGTTPLGGCVKQKLTKMLFSARRELNLDMTHKAKMPGNSDLVDIQI